MHALRRWRIYAATVRVVDEAESSDRAPWLMATGNRLRIDAAAAEVLQDFERAGVGALLLKGPSITRWLYADDPSRGYVDCDLLIAPTGIATAERLLRTLGYTPHFDDHQMPSWWREHAGDWVRDRDGVTVDLHRRLPGVGVSPAAAWSLLATACDRVSIAGHPVRTLTLPARTLHAALHAAHHGVAMAQPLRDLERALAAADDQVWLQAAALAVELDAADAFATGLRLVPAGVALAERLGLGRGGSVDVQLRATTPPPVALGFEQLARAHGIRRRAAILRWKLVPPPAFVRHWDPRAADGRLALLRAYVRRPLWLLRQAPRGLAAWIRARRDSGRRAGGP